MCSMKKVFTTYKTMKVVILTIQVLLLVWENILGDNIFGDTCFDYMNLMLFSLFHEQH